MFKLFTPAIPVLLVSSLLLTGGVWAQGKSDFSQAIEISSERDFFDLANNLAVFNVNVLIRQGSLEIRADNLEVKRESEQSADSFVARGNPATYQQRLEDGSLIQAEASEISYDQAKQLIILRGQASVSQNNSLIRGDEIVYDFASQQLRAHRNESDEARVTTIFLPKKGNDEPVNR